MAVLTCTHNLCFEQNFSIEFLVIFEGAKSLYIAWAFRNVSKSKI